MSAKYWIKLYHEILYDVKMAKLPDRLWRRLVELFLFAGDYNKEGELPKVSEMAWVLHLGDDEFTKDLDELKALKFLHQKDDKWYVTQFAKRQQAMKPSEYMRRSRQSTEYSLSEEEDTEEVREKIGSNEIKFKLYAKYGVGMNDEHLHDACLEAYNMRKGTFRKSSVQFALMTDEFKRAGVTVTDYLQAIDERDADDRYKGDSPTVYKTWALNLAKKNNK